MSKLFEKIADKLRSQYDPNPHRRKEVIHFLAQRPALSHQEWHSRYAASRGIPLDFVCWYRDTCSKYFEYDLSSALPDDRLCEDLGMYDATWSDVDWDILEVYEDHYNGKIPDDDQQRIVTFGQFLEALWLHAQKQNK